VVNAKKVLDPLVTALIGVAAVVVVWRAFTIGGTRVSPSSDPLQDISSSQLVTSVAGAPFVGSEVAPVVMIEYADLECPFCSRYASDAFRSVESDFVRNGSIQYVFRNFPIEQIHTAAIPSAKAARCAARQDRYMDLRTHLFANQRELAHLDWAKMPTDIGLDSADFLTCFSDYAASEVDSEKKEGARLGVSSTPTFLFGRRTDNGQVRLLWRLAGAVPYSALKSVLDRLVPATRKER
jgi:protein-disulfide isomerase